MACSRCGGGLTHADWCPKYASKPGGSGGGGSGPALAARGGGGRGSTDLLLSERKNTHGSFEENSLLTQRIVDLCSAASKYDDMSADQREAVHMVAHKIARICCGDPNFADHWDDVSGYAVLIANRLRR